MKMAEMSSEDSRFLIVRDLKSASKDVVAFVHLKFDNENEEQVLYVYEIQLAPAFRRKGLGKFLMQTCELIARRAKMEGLMLTVLGTDTEARAFYDKLKYEQVFSSEEELVEGDDEDELKRYAIMAKDFREPKEETKK